MLFIGFEYKSQEECKVVLRKAATGGAIDIGHLDMKIDNLRMIVDSADSFLDLFDAGILAPPMKEEVPGNPAH